MNTDKAYILGLVIGGGCFGPNGQSFSIRLPYRQWGLVAANPERAGIIASDIMHVVKPLMSIEYGLDITYTTGKVWTINCIGDTSRLIQDLRSYNIEPTSELHKTADIGLLIQDLTDTNMKKRFIAGVADTIGSMAPSHRRFSDEVQIISFEISGYNYRFVCQLCNLLYDVGCIPDQILWQHPNMQAGNDSYYKSWKKGNKLRVTLDAFSTFGSLAFRSKSLSSSENLARESSPNYNAGKCEERPLSVSGVVAVHIDENHPDIPDEIRGGHYIHHKQICGALSCPHAPCDELDKLMQNAENYISPFAALHKDSARAISALIARDPLLSEMTYTLHEVPVADIVRYYEEGTQTIQFIDGAVHCYSSRRKGYPITFMMDAVAFILASRLGLLNGKRPQGNRGDLIQRVLSNNPNETVKVHVPNLLTPIIVTDDNVSAMVGPMNTAVYKNLISFDDTNKYKMLVRPITKEDLL